MSMFSRRGEPKQPTAEPTPFEAKDVGFIDPKEIKKHEAALHVLADIEEVSSLVITIHDRLEQYEGAIARMPKQEAARALLTKLLEVTYGSTTSDDETVSETSGAGAIDIAGDLINAFERFKKDSDTTRVLHDLQKELIVCETEANGTSHYDRVDGDLNHIGTLERVKQLQEDATHADTIAARTQDLRWYQWLKKRAGVKEVLQREADIVSDVEDVREGFAERAAARDALAEQIATWKKRQELQDINRTLQNIDAVSIVAEQVITLQALNDLSREQHVVLADAMEQLADIDMTKSTTVPRQAENILKTVELAIDPEAAKESLHTYLQGIEKDVKKTIGQIETNMAGVETIFDTFGETVTDADREQFQSLAGSFQAEVATLMQKITSLRERIDSETDPKKIMGLERVLVGSDAQLTNEFDVSVQTLQAFMTELSQRALKKKEVIVIAKDGSNKRELEFAKEDTFDFRAVTMLERLLKEGANASDVVAGLEGLDSDRAWEMRERLLNEGVDNGILASSFAGLDSDRAWEMRERLLNEGAYKGTVARSFAGLDSDRAWEMRERLLNEGVIKDYVASSFAGLDSDRAWEMRERLLNEGVEHKDIIIGISGDEFTTSVMRVLKGKNEQ